MPSKWMKKVTKEIVFLPTPSGITYSWNFGSLLGLCLTLQIMSGLFLSMHYEASVEGAFSSVVSIMNDKNFGWTTRYLHANGASLFFVLIYLHIGRGLYYGSFRLKWVWSSGVMILLLLMGTAFLGYVLPWGQMSLWGATVITSLISAIPYFGEALLHWVWGGFSVGSPTLSRMFSLHFILPFALIALVGIHLGVLHVTGSSNPLGVSLNSSKTSFHPFFSVKDILGGVLVLVFLSSTVLISPDMLMDPDNFSEANPMVTPPHIQPEWYFLFAYSILRSIPSKLGGVVALVMSILIILALPFFSQQKVKSSRFFFLYKTIFILQTGNFFILTWLGSQPVEEPFILLGKLLTWLYFTLFILWSI